MLDSLLLSHAAAQRNGYTLMNAVVDPRLNGLGSAATSFTMRQDRIVTGGLAVGPNAVKAKLALSSDSALAIEANSAVTLAGEKPMDSPTKCDRLIPNNETVTCYGDNANQNEITSAVFFLRHGRKIGFRSPRRVDTVLVTSTTAGVAHTWTDLTLTWPSLKPYYDYEILGVTGYSASAAALRWKSYEDHLAQHRPTFCLGGTSMTSKRWLFDEPMPFNERLKPTLELLDTTTGAAHQIGVILAEIGPGQGSQQQQQYQQQ